MMTKTKKIYAAAEAEASEQPEKTDIAPKFTVEKLQAYCLQLFGVSTSTFAGATYGMTGEYTIEEMKTHIKMWKKKGMK